MRCHNIKSRSDERIHYFKDSFIYVFFDAVAQDVKLVAEDREATEIHLLLVRLEPLVDEGVDSLHFYTLNRPELTRDVCRALGVVPQSSLSNVA